MYTLHSLLLILSQLSTRGAYSEGYQSDVSGEKVWAIAHRINGEKTVDEALKLGVNALEMDLVYTSEGEYSHFYHHCTCHCVVESGSCPYILSHFCEGPRNATQVLSHFMAHPLMDSVGMIYIDSKLESVTDLARAAQNTVKLLEINLFERGYAGIALIFSFFNTVFHPSLISTVRKSPFQSRIFLVTEKYGSFLDDIIPNSIRVNSMAAQNVQTQARMRYRQMMFSAGTSLCFQNIQDLYEEVVLGRMNTAAGVFGEVTVWTLNQEERFDKYYNMGARGFITDNLEGFMKWTRKRGYQLYGPGDIVHRGSPMNPQHIITTIGECGCGVVNSTGGCAITRPAPPYSACQCDADTCTGLVVGCRDMSDIRCLTPDTSYTSCLLGSGDCSGYPEPSDCGCDQNGVTCNNTVWDVGACKCTCETRASGLCQGVVSNCQVNNSSSSPTDTISLVLISWLWSALCQ